MLTCCWINDGCICEMDQMSMSLFCYQFVILLNSVVFAFALCPLNCQSHQNCTDPDSGCPNCEPEYWGRQCEYRTECQFANKRDTQYQGLKKTTIDGILCQDWSAQTPHAHNVLDVTLTENYCRIVTSFNDRQFPWCFTTDPAIEWRYCGVKLCDFQCPAPPLKSFEIVINPPTNGFEVGHEIHISDGSRSTRHTCMPDLCWSDLSCPDSNTEDNITQEVSNLCPRNCQSITCKDPDNGCFRCKEGYWGRQCQYRTECMYDRNGVSYGGLRNTTRLGTPCQHWSEQSPHPHPFSGPHLIENYCRNPAGGGYNYFYPWCYTVDAGTSWDYCGIDYCSLQCPAPNLRYQSDVLNPSPNGFYIGYVLLLYNGKRSELTNHTCTPELCWSSLTCPYICPPNCGKKKCKDPDGGCDKCLLPYWGRQCQHRMECRKDVYGISYRGFRNMTEKGNSCQHWSAQNTPSNYILRMELTENHCRNPDNSKQPWCFTDESFTVKEFCDIESCYRQCFPPPLGPYDDVQNPPSDGFNIGYEIELKKGDTITRHTCTENRCWSDLTCKQAAETESTSTRSIARTVTTSTVTITSTSQAWFTTINNTSALAQQQNSEAINMTDCCGCIDTYWNNTSKTNDEEFTKMLNIRLAVLKEELSVNQTTLSSYVRRKTSAGDDRSSASYIGYIGAAVIIAVIASFVTCDMLSFRRHSKQCKSHKKIKIYD